MRINHNIASLNTYRQLSTNNANGAKSLEKLSSGLRINKAGDDAAGLAISEKMRGQIRGLDQASRNAQDGISMIQTAEGALNETHSILQRMRELAVQSSTDTNTSGDRTKIQAEVDQLAKEITRISNTTEFNTKNLLAGGLNNTFHIGANQGQNVSLSINAMDAQSLGVAGVVITQGATTAVGNVTSASNLGSGLGAMTYKLQTTKTAMTVGAAASSGGANTAGTMAGTYTGTADEALRMEVMGIDGNNDITSVRVSTDGGTTWGGAFAFADGMNIGSGVTYTMGGGNYAVGNTISSAVTADKFDIQLQNAAGVAIGNTVTVSNAATSASIGDASIAATMDVAFTAAAITSAGSSNFQVVSTTGSTAAVVNNGSVQTAANTLAGISVTSQGAANTAITTINNAMETVSTSRANLGAMQNRLEHTINNLGTSSENLTASESRVRDVDMAKEMMEFTKNNILSQAAQAMLAQANQAPQGVLQLLR